MPKLLRFRLVRVIAIAFGVVVALQCTTHEGEQRASAVNVPPRVDGTAFEALIDRKEVAQ